MKLYPDESYTPFSLWSVLKDVRIHGPLALMMAGIAVFTILIAALNFYAIGEWREQVKFTQAERDGTFYQERVMSLVKDIQEYRGLYYLWRRNGGERPGRLEELEREIDSLSAAVDRANGIWGEEFGTTGKWNDIEARYASLKEEEERLDPATVFERYTAIVSSLLNLVYDVGDASNLITDPELDTYYLMNITVNILPELSEETGQLRGRASELASGRNNAVIAASHVRINHLLRRLNRSARVLYKEDPVLEETLSPLVRETNSLFTEFSGAFEQAAAGNIEGSDQHVLFARGTALIDSYMELYVQVAKDLDRLLDERIRETKRKMNAVIFLCALILALTLSSYVFYYINFMRRYQAELALLDTNLDLEARVLQRTHELYEAREKAEAASRTKSEFLANMSHEIRTPMNGIIGAADLMTSTSLDKTQQNYLSTIIKSARGLLQLINDILDLSKIEAGRMTLHIEPFDLRLMCEEIRSVMQVSAKKGVVMDVRWDESLPRHVSGDSGRLRQILINLVGNAVKFTEKGKITLHVDGKEDDENTVLYYIAIEDTGIGIPPDKLATIFDKFTQVDEMTTRRHGGTGLGLSICRELVQMMGGHIAVESVAEKGSVFRVSLKLQKSAAPSGQEPAIGSASVKDLLFDGIAVLLAEDNPTNQMIAGEMLTQYGCDVAYAETGREVLEKTQQRRFDIVFMDCRMPEMDGYDATRSLRAQEEGTGRRTPVVALTANAMRGDRERCLAAGMDDYISKPVQKEDIGKMLFKWVPPEKRKADRASGTV